MCKSTILDRRQVDIIFEYELKSHKTIHTFLAEFHFRIIPQGNDQKEKR